MQCVIQSMSSPAPHALPVEIVECKGHGHPDTICDALAESVSVGLCRAYIQRFGAILHHNVDKGLLIGGAAEPAFGGGTLVKPIEITLAGRATQRFGGSRVPIEALVNDLAREWLETNLHHIAPGDVHVRVRVRETSPDLSTLFARHFETGTPLANDSSFGVGYAPLDRLERAVLAVERRLASDETRRMYPAIGDDTKVMGMRRGETFTMTIACAIVDRYIRHLADYRDVKDVVRRLVQEAAGEETGTPVAVEVNAADCMTSGSIYLTVTGLSAEAGDDGQVGRGNRVNGLITPYRPMSLEAAAGKNPVSHTGKLYNVLARRIADALVRELDGVSEAYCYLLSRIGDPIDEPVVTDIHLRLDEPHALEVTRGPAEELVRSCLAGAGELWREAQKDLLLPDRNKASFPGASGAR